MFEERKIYTKVEEGCNGRGKKGKKSKCLGEKKILMIKERNGRG